MTNRTTEISPLIYAGVAGLLALIILVSGFTPFYLTGDFNGDGMQDIVIVVRIKERRTALPNDVRLINPFWYGPKVTFPTNPAAEKTLALAIIHSWKTPQTATKFLLVGEAPLLIFVYDRTSDPESAKGLMELSL